MSRLFTGGTGGPHLSASAVAALQAAHPFSLALWIADNPGTGTQAMFAKGTNRILLDHNVGTFRVNAGDSTVVANDGALTANALTHIGAIVNGASTFAYLNGVQSGGALSTGAISAVADAVYVGHRPDSAASKWVGRLAEVAVWVGTLNASEFRALARGVSPLIVRPLALRIYLPLWGLSLPEIDLRSRNSFAQSGSALAAARHVPSSPMAL